MSISLENLYVYIGALRGKVKFHLEQMRLIPVFFSCTRKALGNHTNFYKKKYAL